MDLELNHFFILTAQPKEAGDLLVSFGLNEGFSRDHRGQGTSNRRFMFSNGMLELLYVRDLAEAKLGVAKDLQFPNRIEDKAASPFGLVLNRVNKKDRGVPFSGWEYQPEFFAPPNAFHIGANSVNLEEPLCIYAPFFGPSAHVDDANELPAINDVEVSVSVEELSEVLHAAGKADGLSVVRGESHLVVMTMDDAGSGLTKDFRPVLPLIIKY